MTANAPNVFQTKQGKCILTLFFIVLAFQIGLSIWDHCAPNGVYRTAQLRRSEAVSAVYAAQTEQEEQPVRLSAQ